MFILLRMNGLERVVHAVGRSSIAEVDVFNNLTLNLYCKGLKPTRRHLQEKVLKAARASPSWVRALLPVADPVCHLFPMR
jgi:hypothetical protein